MEVDLILLDIYGLDVTLGMDWSVASHAFIDYYKKEVVFKRSSLPVVVFDGECKRPSSSLISTLTTRCLLINSFDEYLLHVIDT